MAVQTSPARNSSQQPFGRVIGLLSGCLVVGLCGWNGLRPETILTRAIIVGCVMGAAARMLIVLFSTVFAEEDD